MKARSPDIGTQTLDNIQSTLVTGLSQLTSKDFARISMAHPKEGKEAVEITYRFENSEVTMTFNIEDPLTLERDVILVSPDKSSDLALAEEAHSALASIFCTHDLFVLIKRYQFLLNASYSDESLKEFFTVDRYSNPTRIEFYPLMTLVTAYYESH